METVFRWNPVEKVLLWHLYPGWCPVDEVLLWNLYPGWCPVEEVLLWYLYPGSTLNNSEDPLQNKPLEG